ncbi:hypothetical protein G9A89_012638 [Geosiphon pyriformis]|nr:hypothetical protein G9A89_012638 [Geosiphon pyriformis]
MAKFEYLVIEELYAVKKRRFQIYTLQEEGNTVKKTAVSKQIVDPEKPPVPLWDQYQVSEKNPLCSKVQYQLQANLVVHFSVESIWRILWRHGCAIIKHKNYLDIK